jgi:hypothetical protein
MLLLLGVLFAARVGAAGREPLGTLSGRRFNRNYSPAKPLPLIAAEKRMAGVPFPDTPSVTVPF